MVYVKSLFDDSVTATDTDFATPTNVNPDYKWNVPTQGDELIMPAPKLTGEWMTITMVLLVVIAALVGGAVVIWGNPGTLSFKDYLDDLKSFSFAVAGLGGARALVAAAKSFNSN